jgi:hypothetical protein
MNSTRRIAVLACGVLALAACGASAPSSADVAASSPSARASSVAAASASPTSAKSPSPTPAVAARCDKVAKPFNAGKVDLSGPWAGDDNGIYYLRQVGSLLWWNGMSERAGTPALLGREWNNVARGEIKSPAIEVEWADVPRGGILGNGTLSLKIEDDGSGNVRIVKVSETGTGFGNSVWTPCRPG